VRTARAYRAAKKCAGRRSECSRRNLPSSMILTLWRDLALLKSRYGIEFVNIPLKTWLTGRNPTLPQPWKSQPCSSPNVQSGDVGRRCARKQARILRAIREMTKEGGLRASHPLLAGAADNVQAWPCPSLSILTMKRATACEGDPAAPGHVAVVEIGQVRNNMLDVVIGTTEHTFAIWHCDRPHAHGRRQDQADGTT